MNSSVSSGPLTANTLLANASYVKSVLVGTGATVTLYNGTDTTGKNIFSAGAGFYDFAHMVQSKNGLYVAVSGGTAYVYYN